MSETVQSQGRPLAQAVRGELLERKSGAGRELAYWQGGHSSLHPGDSEWRPGSTAADEEHLMESEVRVRGTGGHRTQSVPEAGAEDRRRGRGESPGGRGLHVYHIVYQARAPRSRG